MTDELENQDGAPSRLSRLVAPLARVPRPPRSAWWAGGSGLVIGVAVALLAAGTPAPAAEAEWPQCTPVRPTKPPPGGSLSTSWLRADPGGFSRGASKPVPAAVVVDGIPQAGTRSSVTWRGLAVTEGPTTARLSIGDDLRTLPLGMSFETSDPTGSDLLAVYLTEPHRDGSSTAGLRLQADLPWLRLQPRQSASVYTATCEKRVEVTRPSEATRWEIRVTDNPSAGRFTHYFTPTSIVLETDAERPPFGKVHLDVRIADERRRARVVVDVPAA